MAPSSSLRNGQASGSFKANFVFDKDSQTLHLSSDPEAERARLLQQQRLKANKAYAFRGSFELDGGVPQDILMKPSDAKPPRSADNNRPLYITTVVPTLPGFAPYPPAVYSPTPCCVTKSSRTSSGLCGPSQRSVTTTFNYPPALQPPPQLVYPSVVPAPVASTLRIQNSSESSSCCGGTSSTTVDCMEMPTVTYAPLPPPPPPPTTIIHHQVSPPKVVFYPLMVTPPPPPPVAVVHLHNQDLRDQHCVYSRTE